MSELAKLLPMALDLILLTSVVVLAALVLGGHRRATGRNDARRRVILFIAFGLLLALLWASLGAPDVALAEAAIGAGFAGALLFAAANALPDEAETKVSAARNASPAPVGHGLEWLINFGIAAFAILLLGALWLSLPALDVDRLGPAVRTVLPETGVSNPVTAVLLNLRAFDTLLEIAVLLTAALAIRQLGPARAASAAPEGMLTALVPWLVPALILTAGYLLWVGAHAPGGAFQAGAMLAAAGVVLHLTGRSGGGLPSPRWQPWALIAAVAVFLAVGLAGLALNGVFLGYRGASASVLILLIETAATLGIAAMLISAYLGGDGGGHEAGDEAGQAPGAPR